MSILDRGGDDPRQGPTLTEVVELLPTLVYDDPVVVATLLADRYGDVVRVPPLHPALDSGVYLLSNPEDVQSVLQSDPSDFRALDVPGSRDFSRVVNYPTLLRSGAMAPLARCGEGFRVDSRSMPRLRREGRILHSRSTSRDLLTGAQRPFAWSEGPPVPRYSSARLRVRLRRLRFACDGDTANQCSWKRCNRRGSGSHSPDTRTPRRGGWRHGLNPQVEHRFEVLRGSTWTASTPCSLALYATYS